MTRVVLNSIALCLAMASASAAAQTAGLYDQAGSDPAVTAGFKLTVPLGGQPQSRRNDRHVKLGFALDYRRANAAPDFGPQLFGVRDYKNLSLLDLSVRGNGNVSTSLYGQDMRALFVSNSAGADQGPEGESNEDSGVKTSSRGLVTGMIIGGVVVIGAGVVLANEFVDDTEDVADCIVSAIIGDSDCPPQ